METTNVTPDHIALLNDRTHMNWGNAPPEVIELILKKLDHDSMKQCRLVCKRWNHEILKHLQLCLVIDDSKCRNLKFIQSVNIPASFSIKSLKLINIRRIFNPNYRFKYGHVGLISIRFPNRTIQKINLRTLSNYCYNLKILSLHRPSLATCDFSTVNCGSLNSTMQILPNLNELYIRHIEEYNLRCDGLEISQLSKNIFLLLQSIGSVNLKSLTIKLNSSYCDINSCNGRKQYRFEEKVLPEFICHQQKLETLVLDIPIALIAIDIGTQYTVPSTLKHVKVKNRVGVVGVHNNLGQIVENRHLLEWDNNEFDILMHPSLATFWKSFLAAQKNLEFCTFQGHSNFGEADFVNTFIQQNMVNLHHCTIEAMITGNVNCEHFQGALKLEDLYISNCITEENFPQGEGDCHLVNLQLLPPNLKILKLINVTLALLEIQAIPQGLPLQVLQFVYDWNHYVQLEGLPEFHEILETLVNRDSFQELTFGLVHLSNEQQQQVAQGDYWYDHNHHLIYFLRNLAL